MSLSLASTNLHSIATIPNSEQHNDLVALHISKCPYAVHEKNN